MRELKAQQLKDYLDAAEQSPFLLDVRQPWEFDVCRIEGSELIPMSQIPVNLNKLDSERETVVICHHGIRSRSIGKFLESMGFNNIINLSDGVNGWAKTVDNQMATY